MILQPDIAKLPAVTLAHWAALHGVGERTARKWTTEGQPLHGRVWASGVGAKPILLIRPDEPVPTPARGRRKGQG